MGVSLSKNYIARHTSFRCNNLLGELNTCCRMGEEDLIACLGFERDDGVVGDFIDLRRQQQQQR